MIQEDLKSQFSEFHPKEIVNKIAILVKDKEQIKVWKKGQKPFQCKVVNSSSQKEVILNLESEGINSSWNNSEILIHFNLKGLDYFAKAKMQSLDSQGLFEAQLENPIYRLEKRGEERLLTYPHHQVYLYFESTENKTQNNVISIKKEAQIDRKIYNDFKRKELEALNLDVESENLIGLRVMDLSSKGLSLLANKIEKDMLSEQLEKGVFYLLLNSNSFTLSLDKIIYSVDYVDSRSPKIPLSKIGIEFKVDKNLTSLVERMINKSELLNQFEKDFEGIV